MPIYTKAIKSPQRSVRGSICRSPCVLQRTVFSSSHHSTVLAAGMSSTRGSRCVATMSALGAPATEGLDFPGKLGAVPDGGTGSDPRLHSKFVDFFKSAEMGGDMSPPPWDPSLPSEQQHELFHEADAGYLQLLSTGPTNVYTDQIIEESQWVTSDDGTYQIELRVMRKKGTEEQELPCLYHTHGGAMAIQTTRDTLYNNHLEAMVAGPTSETHPIVAVAVEYRLSNGAPRAESRPGNPQAAMDYPPSPFPLGLDDCFRGIQHVFENKASLGISTICVSGESGGGNLSTACSLYAKRMGCLDIIDGVYALCPYIAGDWVDASKSLVSIVENDGIFLSSTFLNMIGEPLYQGGEDICAWPLKATIDDLRGLPPHMISVNECDPLRDEGMEYFRKLDKAGVSVAGRMVLGTPHAGDYFHQQAPEAAQDTHASIKHFMYSLPCPQ